MSIEIRIPNINKWESKIDGVCWRLEKLSKGDKVKLDIKNIHFLRPQGTIMLFLICKEIYGKTNELIEICNIEPAVHAYIERVDMLAFPFIYTKKNISIWHKYARRNNSKTIVELTKMNNVMQLTKFIERVKFILKTWYPESNKSKFRSDVSTMIAEVCNNSLEHSLGNNNFGECFCQLQKYSTNTGSPEIAIAIGDIGLGIRKHLQRRFSNLKNTDTRCISKVVDGLSGRLDGTGGLGIPYIIKTIKKYNGKLLIRSGRGAVEISNNMKRYEFGNSFPGTQSLLILN